MIDHYRIPGELILAALFCVLLVLFAGRTGVRALVSFAVCVLMIWKVLVPCCLNGVNPIWIGLGVVLIMAAMTVSLVYGFDRRALASLGGCALAIAVTCVMGMIFTDQFKIHGAVMSYSESLLYSGYSQLNLTRIFMASIFIGASGAVMDLAVDITSSVSEVVEKKPDITAREAIKSGFTVGRAALSTQTTTLLLAYSGGLYSPADGVHGPGHAALHRLQPQVRGRGDPAHHGRLLRPRHRGPAHRDNQRVAPDAQACRRPARRRGIISAPPLRAALCLTYT